MAMTRQQLAASEMFAGLAVTLAEKYPDDEGVGVGDITGLPSGLMAGVLLPTGDRYRVRIEWVGDNEGDAPEVETMHP